MKLGFVQRKAPSLHLSWVCAAKNTIMPWNGLTPLYSKSVICSAHFIFGAECFDEQAISSAAINLMAEQLGLCFSGSEED